MIKGTKYHTLTEKSTELGDLGSTSGWSIVLGRLSNYLGLWLCHVKTMRVDLPNI